VAPVGNQPETEKTNSILTSQRNPSTRPEEKIQRLIPETEKTGKNVGLGVAGVFLIVPWFFMDFTKSEKIEAEALRDRYNQLLVIAEDKNCGFNRQPIPEFKKSAEAVEQLDTEE